MLPSYRPAGVADEAPGSSSWKGCCCCDEAEVDDDILRRLKRRLESDIFGNMRAIWRHRGSSLLACWLAGGLLGLEMQFLKQQGFQDEISQRRGQLIQAEGGGVVRGRRKQARWQTVDGVIRALWLGDSSRWRVAAVPSSILTRQLSDALFGRRSRPRGPARNQIIQQA